MHPDFGSCGHGLGHQSANAALGFAHRVASRLHDRNFHAQRRREEVWIPGLQVPTNKIKAKLVDFRLKKDIFLAEKVQFQAKIAKFQAKVAKFHAKIAKFLAKSTVFQAKIAKFQAIDNDQISTELAKFLAITAKLEAKTLNIENRSIFRPL